MKDKEDHRDALTRLKRLEKERKSNDVVPKRVTWKGREEKSVRG